MYGVTITELIKKMDFRNLTPEIDADKIVLSHPDVNRPALQLTGFYDCLLYTSPSPRDS